MEDTTLTVLAVVRDGRLVAVKFKLQNVESIACPVYVSYIIILFKGIRSLNKYILLTALMEYFTVH